MFKKFKSLIKVAAVTLALTGSVQSLEVEGFTPSHVASTMKYSFLVNDTFNVVDERCLPLVMKPGQQSWFDVLGFEDEEIVKANKASQGILDALEVNEAKDLAYFQGAYADSDETFLNEIYRRTLNDEISCFEFAEYLSREVSFLNDIYDSGKKTLSEYAPQVNKERMERGFNNSIDELRLWLERDDAPKSPYPHKQKSELDAAVDNFVKNQNRGTITFEEWEARNARKDAESAARYKREYEAKQKERDAHGRAIVAASCKQYKAELDAALVTGLIYAKGANGYKEWMPLQVHLQLVKPFLPVYNAQGCDIDFSKYMK